MQNGLGPTLRKARNRRKETLSDVEAAIKIRVRHLRAIEEEDWEALPGGSYGRSFIRTYANHLGLDGDRLAGELAPRTEPLPAGGAPRRRPQVPRAAVTGVVVLALVAVIVAVGLATGNGGGGSATVSPHKGAGEPSGGAHGRTAPAAGRTREAVVLSLATKAEVWVCVLDEKGRPLVEGEVLRGGMEEGPFRSGSFTVAFGNGEVAMQVDGRQADIPESASPLGYAIDPQGDLRPLPEGERPTCL